VSESALLQEEYHFIHYRRLFHDEGMGDVHNYKFSHAFQFCPFNRDLAVILSRDDPRGNGVNRPVAGYYPKLKISGAQSIGNTVWTCAQLHGSRAQEIFE
jgi:hypothetical protein